TRKQQILARLPRDGSFISNNKIYEPLNLSPEEFSEIQAELLDERLIVVGRGRYGRTARVTNGLGNGDEYPASEIGVTNENELYPAVKDYFDRKWKHNYEPSPPNLYISEITANPPRPGSTASIPDISILTIMKYDFVPGNVLELITVDVVKYGELDQAAVYKTATMSMVSHRAFMVFEWVEDDDFSSSGSKASLIITEVKRFGIGLIQMRQINNGKWEFKTILEPHLQSPELGELNSYIEIRLKKEHARIRGAIG
ncbi:MAG: hypothetical protein RTU30_15185, partial [Candidatus Thorarchaeota archaeon]